MMTDSDVTSPQVEALRLEIADAEAKRSALEDIKRELVQQKSGYSLEIEKIRAAANVAIQALHDQKQSIDSQLIDINRDLRTINDELRALEAKLRLALEAAMRSDRYKAKSLEFESIAAGFKWREFAFDYQLQGAKLMATAERAINADKMGLGKTLQSLMALDMLQVNKALIICPANITGNFVRELEKWAPHRVVFNLHGMTKAERNAVLLLSRTVNGPITLVVNYEAWRKDWGLVDQLIEMRFEAVVCDEFHWIKEPKTNAARGVERLVLANNICPECSGTTVEEQNGIFFWTRCSVCNWNAKEGKSSRHKVADRRSIKYVFPMSGTPVLNRPDELYMGLHLILPELFYDIEVFRSVYCIYDYGSRTYIWAPNGLNNLERHLASHYIARTKKDAGIILPPQEHQIVELEMDAERYPDQWRVMNQINKYAQIVLSSGDKIDMTNVISLIMRKRQANVFPAGIQIKDKDGFVVVNVGDEVTDSIKIDYAIDLIKDVTSDGDKTRGERVVVFSQFKGPLHELAKRLNAIGIAATVMDGDSTSAHRTNVQLDFDRTFCSETEYEHQVLCTNYRTGGTGLNLTAATQVIILDEPWNPGTFDQALDRVNRIGQTRDQTVTIIRIAKTIDDWLADLIATKKEIVDGFEMTGRELTKSLLEAMQNGTIV